MNMSETVSTEDAAQAAFELRALLDDLPTIPARVRARRLLDVIDRFISTGRRIHRSR